MSLIIFPDRLALKPIYRLCTAKVSQKGSIEIGSDADLVILDPNKEWTITADKLHMQAGWTMFEGLAVKGKVFATYVRGKKVYEDGKVIGAKGYGKWVKKVRNYDL